MAESDDTSEVDLVDLVEPGISAFAELFAESEKMQVVGDIVNIT